MGHAVRSGRHTSFLAGHLMNGCKRENTRDKLLLLRGAPDLITVRDVLLAEASGHFSMAMGMHASQARVADINEHFQGSGSQGNVQVVARCQTQTHCHCQWLIVSVCALYLQQPVECSLLLISSNAV